MVRLKDLRPYIETQLTQSFNSKVVRLKGAWRRLFHKHQFGFQFQSGAVKRAFIAVLLGMMFLFQFQSGAVKRMVKGMVFME